MVPPSLLLLIALEICADSLKILPPFYPKLFVLQEGFFLTIERKPISIRTVAICVSLVNTKSLLVFTANGLIFTCRMTFEMALPSAVLSFRSDDKKLKTINPGVRMKITMDAQGDDGTGLIGNSRPPI